METVLGGVGSCNTQLEARIGRSLSVHEVGVDTWRLARYMDDDHDFAVARRFFADGQIEKINDHSLGWMPRYRMLWIEGHPAVDCLAPPKTLASAERRVLKDVHELGLPTGRDGGVRRYDSTVTLRFEQPAEGLAFLRGIAAIDFPRLKKAVYEGVHGDPETVYLIGPGGSKRILARCYDKGVEQGRGAPRGELIRLENQQRVPKLVAETLTATNMTKHSHLVGQTFANRFAPVAQSVDGIRAATAPVIADRLAELQREGRLSAAKAARLLGYLIAGERMDLPDRTARRWRAELREFGLVLVDPLGDDIDVDLGESLTAALAAWSAQ